MLTPVTADARLVRHEEGQPFTPSPQWLKNEGFSSSPLPGHSTDVWFRDSRIEKPGYTKGIVFLITQVGVWSGELTITNETGALAMTDDQVDSTWWLTGGPDDVPFVFDVALNILGPTDRRPPTA